MATHHDWAGAARRPAAAVVRRRTFFLGAVGLLVGASTALCGASPAAAEDPANRALTSRAAREDALRAIPLGKLSPEDRGKVRAVVQDVSVFRRLPVQAVDCEPELFHYMVRNPEIIVGIWQVMGVTNVNMERIDADHFRCADGDGTTARAEIVFQNHDTCVVYAEGVYDGPLFPRAVRGECVLVLKTAGLRETNGRYYVTVRLDTFLHVDNFGVEMVAKMFQSWMGLVIDHNFAETVAFLGSVSRTAETNPAGMRKLAGRLVHVEPNRRERFAQLTDQVAEKLSGVELVGGARPTRQ